MTISSTSEPIYREPDSSERPLVSIIVLNHNGLSRLQMCFDAVIQQDYPNYEIIFVDNGSSDGSLEWASAKLSDTSLSYRIEALQNNLGINRGKNRGARWVTYISGGVMFVRTSAWTKVGGFENSAVFSLNDTDFGVRCWLAGFKVALVCECYASHCEAAAVSGDLKKFRYRQRITGVTRFILRNFSAFPMIVHLLTYKLFLLARTAKYVVRDKHPGILLDYLLAQGRDGLGKTAYERHQPEQTLLYQLVEAHYPALVDQLAQQGKFLPDHVHREFEAYLKCGRLERLSPGALRQMPLRAAGGVFLQAWILPQLWRSQDGRDRSLTGR